MDQVPGGDRQAGTAAGGTGPSRRRASCPGNPRHRLAITRRTRRQLSRNGWTSTRGSMFISRRSSSSWLNQVERWFGLLTEKLLRRGVHKSVRQLEKDILAWVDTWNEDPRPFIWTKSAEEILESLGRLLRRIKDPGH